MRLSLFECGQTELHPDEELVLREVLRKAIEQQAATLQCALSEMKISGADA